MFQLMHSHFIFLDSVKAILVNCAHRLLSELTLILCTGTRPVEGDLDDTLARLKLDPFWDPLRGDPAFQKLCEEKQP
jgi:hypothetical protein